MTTIRKMSTTQISDLHAAMVEELGHGIDPAKVRRAVEKAGFAWDTTCPHTKLTKVTWDAVDDGFAYICTTDGHSACHERFKVIGSSSDDLIIDELGLSVRAFNVLKREGVNTVGELCKLGWWDLADMRNMGVKAITDVETQLAKAGRALKESKR